MKRYKIKEMANLMDISPSTLRNFEEKGLLFPHRTVQSGYRQFDPVDLNLLFRIRGFTRCGFSLDETARLMHSEELIPIADALFHKSQLLDQQLRLMALKSQYMKHRARHLLRATHLGREWILDSSPAMYLLPFRTNNQIMNEDDRAQVIRRWASLKPFTESLLLYPLEEMRSGNMGYVCGTCIEKAYGDALGVHPGGHVLLKESQPLCAYTLVSGVTDRTGVAQSANDTAFQARMRQVLRTLAQEGYIPKADAYGTTLHTQVSVREYLHISELWIPLGKK